MFSTCNLLSVLFLLIPVFSFGAGETPQSFTLDGRLYSDPGGTVPVIDPRVTIHIQILDPTQTCILYDESQNVNTITTSGYFSEQVGSPLGSSKRTSGDPALMMAHIYSNTAGNISGRSLANGSSCNYVPMPGDQRYLKFQFTPSSDRITRAISPYMTLDSVPMAVVAERAESVQGLTASQLLQVNTNSPANLSQSNLENVFSNSNYPRLTSLLAVPPANYVQAGSNGAAGVPQIAGQPSTGLSSGQFWYDSGGNVLKFYNGSSVQTVGAAGNGITSLTAGAGLTGGTITTGGQSIAVDTGTTAGKIVQVQTGAKLPALDASNLTNINGSAISSGAINGSTSISTSGNILTTGSVTSNKTYLYDHSGIGPNYIGFQAPTAVSSSYLLTWPSALGSANQVLATDASGILSWVTPSVTSPIAVTSPLINSGSTTAPNLAIQLSSGTQDGALSAGDWTIFNNKMSSSLQAAKIWVGNLSNVATAISPSGDVLMSNTGGFTVVKLNGISLSATAPMTNGQVLRFNGTNWTPNFVAMTDLRSTVTGSNQFANSCASNQTLTYNAVGDVMSCQNISVDATNFASQNANTILAGPTGTSGTPTFRSLASADLPSLSSGLTGILPMANGGTGAATLNGAGIFKNGGNSFGAPAVLGTSDTNNLSLVTNGSPQLTVLSNGNVGIGTTSPVSLLNIAGAPIASASSALLSVGNGGWNGTAGSFSGNSNGTILGLNAGVGYNGNLIDLQYNGASRLSLSQAGFLSVSTGFSTTVITGVDSTGTVYSPNGSRSVPSLNPFIAANNQATDGTIAAYSAYAKNSAGIAQRGYLGFVSNTGAANYTPTIVIGQQTGAATYLERMRIDPLGNVGIGTSSPQVSLDLSSKTDAVSLPAGTTAQQPTTLAAGMIRFNSTNSVVEYYNGTSWTTLTSGASNSYLSSSGGTLSGALTISSGGLNLTSGGITNAGNITNVGSNISGLGAVTLSSGGTAQNLNLSSSTTGAVNLKSGNGTQLSIIDGGASTVDYLTIKGAATNGGILAATAPTLSAAGSDANINLSFAPKGTGNTLFSNGNVGIGTATPNFNLDVNGTLNATSIQSGGIASNGTLNAQAWHGTVYSSSSSSVALPEADYVQMNVSNPNTSDGTQALISFSPNNSNGNTQQAYIAAYSVAGSSSYTPIVVIGQKTGATSYQERMRIDGSGNVGIGTTAPSKTLDVASTVEHDAVNGSTSQIVIRGPSSSTSRLNLGYDTTNGFGFIEALNQGLAWQNLTLQPSGGLVGIGTTSPAYPLDVNGVVHTSSYFVTDDSWGTKWQFAGPSDVMSMDVGTTSWMSNIHANGVTRFRFNSDKPGSINGPIVDFNTNGNSIFYGSVGIGTTSPTGKLSVSDSVAGNVLMSVTNTSTNGGAYSTLGSYSSSYFNEWRIYQAGASQIQTNAPYLDINNNAGYIKLDTMGAERVRIDNSGNVGIGTTSPASKLTVAGAIVSTPTAVATGATLDLSTSNTFTLASVGGSAITLNNFAHGGNYTIVVKDSTSRTYTFTNCNTSRFKPANAPTVASSWTVYSILAISNGSTYDCLINWTTGY